MAVFLILGLLILVLIYFVTRAQMLQKELAGYKQTLKLNDTQVKFVLRTLVNVAGELQKTYVARLNAANKHGLLSQADYEMANFILNHVEFVIMQCSEHKATVEEAFIKALRMSSYDMADVRDYIAKQPTEIKVSWSKNKITGFITACHNISLGKMNTTSADAELPAKDAS